MYSKGSPSIKNGELKEIHKENTLEFNCRKRKTKRESGKRDKRKMTPNI